MRIVYTCPELASSVSSWSSCGKEWTKRYKCDTSFSTLLFSRTTRYSFFKKLLQFQNTCWSASNGTSAYGRRKGIFPRQDRDYSIFTGFWYGSREAFVV